jgi:nicotinate-nucleotide adenylyltransferase
MLTITERQTRVTEKGEQQRIGILGGTFDPVHNAHLMVAAEAKTAAALARVILMPAGAPPHKEARTLTPATHRLAMAALAVRGLAGFEVSDLEIRSPRIDYTVDTLLELRRENPEAKLYFIIGGDSLMALDQWREPDRLMSLAAFVAVYRPGLDLLELERKREELTARFGGEILLVACRGMDISSTEVRRRVAAGLDITGLVPVAVEAYISEYGLYREGA